MKKNDSIRNGKYTKIISEVRKVSHQTFKIPSMNLTVKLKEGVTIEEFIEDMLNSSYRSSYNRKIDV